MVGVAPNIAASAKRTMQASGAIVVLVVAAAEVDVVVTGAAVLVALSESPHHIAPSVAMQLAFDTG